MADTYNLADGSVIEVAGNANNINVNTSTGVVTLTGAASFYFKRSAGSTPYFFDYTNDNRIDMPYRLDVTDYTSYSEGCVNSFV